MSVKPFLIVGLSALYAWLFWIVYLLVARPTRFVEGFWQRPYRAWGITVVVNDEAKLRRQARRLGLVLFILLVVHATLVMRAVLSCHR